MTHPSGPRTRGEFVDVREIFRDIQQAAQGAAAGTSEKARDVATSAADKAKEAVTSIGETASGVACTIGQKAKDATEAVGGSMKSLAANIRENTPDQGKLGSASSAVACSLESGGRYLQEEGLSGVAQDVGNVIRRNPIPAVLIGIGLGFVLARTMRS